MRYTIILLFALFTLSTQAQTQHILGAKLGVSVSNVNQDLLNTQSLTGFTGGLSYNTIFGGHLMLGTDVLFAQRGFKTDLNLDLPGFEIPGFDIAGWEFAGFDFPGFETGFAFRNIKYTNEYLSLPVKIGYIGGNKLKGYGQIGVVPSFLMSSKLDIPIFILPDVEIDTERYTNEVDWAGMLEAGMMYQVSEKTMLTGSVSYQKSFTPQYTGWVDRFNDARARAVNVSVGLAFNL